MEKAEGERNYKLKEFSEALERTTRSRSTKVRGWEAMSDYSKWKRERESFCESMWGYFTVGRSNMKWKSRKWIVCLVKIYIDLHWKATFEPLLKLEWTVQETVQLSKFLKDSKWRFYYSTTSEINPLSLLHPDQILSPTEFNLWSFNLFHRRWFDWWKWRLFLIRRRCQMIIMSLNLDWWIRVLVLDDSRWRTLRSKGLRWRD